MAGDAGAVQVIAHLDESDTSSMLVQTTKYQAGATYVISEAASVIQKRAMQRTRPEMPEARRLIGANKLVKKARTSKMRAIR